MGGGDHSKCQGNVPVESVNATRDNVILGLKWLVPWSFVCFPGNFWAKTNFWSDSSTSFQLLRQGVFQSLTHDTTFFWSLSHSFASTKSIKSPPLQRFLIATPVTSCSSFFVGMEHKFLSTSLQKLDYLTPGNCLIAVLLRICQHHAQNIPKRSPNYVKSCQHQSHATNGKKVMPAYANFIQKLMPECIWQVTERSSDLSRV